MKYCLDLKRLSLDRSNHATTCWPARTWSLIKVLEIPSSILKKCPANSKAHQYQRVNRESYSPRIDLSWAHGSYLGWHMGYVSKSLASPWKHMARYKICIVNNVSVDEETQHRSLALLTIKNKYSLRLEINIVLNYQHLFLIEVGISYSSNNSEQSCFVWKKVLIIMCIAGQTWHVT
jgi:hypothetical protein